MVNLINYKISRRQDDPHSTPLYLRKNATRQETSELQHTSDIIIFNLWKNKLLP